MSHNCDIFSTFASEAFRVQAEVARTISKQRASCPVNEKQEVKRSYSSGAMPTNIALVKCGRGLPCYGAMISLCELCRAFKCMKLASISIRDAFRQQSFSPHPVSVSDKARSDNMPL